MLNNRVLAKILVQTGQGVQRGTETDKVERLVEEDAVCHDDGAVGLRLLDGAVAVGQVVEAGPGLQHRELEVQVRVEWEEDREGRQQDVADEACYYVGEGCCDAVWGLVSMGLARVGGVLGWWFLFSIIVLVSNPGNVDIHAGG